MFGCAIGGDEHRPPGPISGGLPGINGFCPKWLGVASAQYLWSNDIGFSMVYLRGEDGDYNVQIGLGFKDPA